MGRRSRARARDAGDSSTRPAAPSSDYSDPDAGTLTLRGALTLPIRAEYARTLAGENAGAAATREDSEQRALELLFGRLAVRWEIAGAAIDQPKQLLGRLRAASPTERAWIRGALREHCAEWFPDVRVP